MAAESRDRAIIGDIIARLDALNGVVQDLLVFARPRELRCEPVDLRALVTSTADLMARDPAMRGLRVHRRGRRKPSRRSTRSSCSSCFTTS